MTAIEKLPRLSFHQTKNEKWLFAIHWREVHAFKPSMWKRVASIALDFTILFVILWLVMLTDYETRYFGFEREGPVSIWWLLSWWFIPTFVLFMAVTIPLDFYVLSRWRGSYRENLGDYYRWKWRTAKCFATLEEEDGELVVEFSTTTEPWLGRPNFLRNESETKTKLSDIRSFIVSNVAEYIGQQHVGSKAPVEDMILVDLGPRGAIPVCRHFGDRQGVAQLQAALMNAFVPGLSPVADTGKSRVEEDDPV